MQENQRCGGDIRKRVRSIVSISVLPTPSSTLKKRLISTSNRSQIRELDVIKNPKPRNHPRQCRTRLVQVSKWIWGTGIAWLGSVEELHLRSQQVGRRFRVARRWVVDDDEDEEQHVKRPGRMRGIRPGVVARASETAAPAAESRSSPCSQESRKRPCQMEPVCLDHLAVIRTPLHRERYIRAAVATYAIYS